MPKERKKHKSRRDRAGEEGGGAGEGGTLGAGERSMGGADSDYCSGSDLSMTDGYIAALKLRQVSSGDRGRGEV